MQPVSDAGRVLGDLLPQRRDRLGRVRVEDRQVLVLHRHLADAAIELQRGAARQGAVRLSVELRAGQPVIQGGDRLLVRRTLERVGPDELLELDELLPDGMQRLVDQEGQRLAQRRRQRPGLPVVLRQGRRRRRGAGGGCRHRVNP